MPFRDRSPPLRRLLLVLVVITQVPAVITMGALVYVQYQRHREEVVHDMVERSRVLAVALRERLEKTQDALEKLAPEVPDDEASLADFQAKAAAALPGAGADAIALVSPAGWQVMNTRVAPGGRLPRATSATMNVFLSPKPSVMDLVPGGVTGRPTAVVAVPVVRDSRIRYALAAGIESVQFKELIERQNLPKGWIAAIVDSKGDIVARQPSHELFVGRQATAEFLDRIRAAAQGEAPMATVFEGRTLDGVDVVASMRRSPVTGWTVVVNVPRSVLITPVWTSAAWLGGFLLLVAGLSIAAALSISGRLAGCIDRLRDAAAALPTDRPVAPGPMCFAEGQLLAQTLVDARSDIDAAKAEVDRVTLGYHRSLMREIEARQREIARELHDSVGSSLAGVTLLLGNASAISPDARLSQLLGRTLEQVQRSVQQVREISRGMAPAGSEAGALLPAIEHFAAEFTRLGVRCTVRARGEFEHVPADVGTHLYRIVQEATNNALRHGGATRIRITLSECNGRHRLTLRDNGRGCNFAAISAVHSGLGLRSMQARARAIDGVLDLHCGPHGGCSVRVAWPNGA